MTIETNPCVKGQEYLILSFRKHHKFHMGFLTKTRRKDSNLKSETQDPTFCTDFHSKSNFPSCKSLQGLQSLGIPCNSFDKCLTHETKFHTLKEDHHVLLFQTLDSTPRWIWKWFHEERIGSKKE